MRVLDLCCGAGGFSTGFEFMKVRCRLRLLGEDNSKSKKLNWITRMAVLINALVDIVKSSNNILDYSLRYFAFSFGERHL